MCAWCAVPLCSSLRAGRQCFSAWHRYEQLGEALHSVHGDAASAPLAAAVRAEGAGAGFAAVHGAAPGGAARAAAAAVGGDGSSGQRAAAPAAAAAVAAVGGDGAGGRRAAAPPAVAAVAAGNR